MTDPTPPVPEPQPDSQLGLFGSESNAPLVPKRSRTKSRPVPTAFDDQRLDSYKALVASLLNKKANDQGVAIAIGTIYRAGFGKVTAELYAHFGLQTNNRADLPTGVLRILIVYELAAQRRVDRHVTQGQTQTEINREIAQQCKIATQIMRRALYWSERAERLEATSLLSQPPADYPLNS